MKKEYLFIIIITLFVILISYLIVQIPGSPDEQESLVTIQTLNQNGFLGFSPENTEFINAGFNTFPNGFNLNPLNGKVLPATFPGFLILSYLFNLINFNFFYINLVLSIIIFLLLYFIFNKYTKYSIIIATLSIFSPLFIHWASLSYSDISSFLVLLTILFFITHPIRNSGIITGILISSWIMFRYTNAIFLPFIFLFFYLNQDSKETKKLILTFAITLLPLLIFNKVTYNAFLTIPDTVNTGNDFSYVSGYVFGDMIFNLYNQCIVIIKNIIFVYPLFILFLPAVIFGMLSFKNNKKYFILLMFLISSLFLGFLFFKVGDSTFYLSAPHLSFYRYLLPLIVLISLPIIKYATNFPKRFMFILILFFIVFSLLLASVHDYNAVYTKESKLDLYEKKLLILNETESSSLIITNFYGKIIYPERSMIRLDVNTTKGAIEISTIIPLINITLKENKSIYIAATPYDQDFNSKINNLSEYYHITQIGIHQSKYGTLLLYSLR